MKPLVSILTPTIEEREQFLAECMASVEAQVSSEEIEHLIGVDVDRVGCSVTMNRLAKAACGEFVLPLADDDLLLPGGIVALLAHCDEGDIVYAPPLMWGWNSWHFFQDPPLIPSFALMRRETWDELGGYEEGIVREEDRGMWVRALDAGKVFVKVEYPCWVYRIHGGNKSMNEGVAS